MSQNYVPACLKAFEESHMGPKWFPYGIIGPIWAQDGTLSEVAYMANIAGVRNEKQR